MLEEVTDENEDEFEFDDEAEAGVVIRLSKDDLTFVVNKPAWVLGLIAAATGAGALIPWAKLFGASML